MDKELRNKISENKILTHNERAKIISDLESYEDLRDRINNAIEEISEYASIWTSYTMDMPKEQIAERCINDCKEQFLEILKRNVGE